MDIATFFVNQVIIHEVPKVNRADKDTSAPRLSDVPSPLTDRLRIYFRERITNSLQKQHFDAVYDPPLSPSVSEGHDQLSAIPRNKPSPVPQLVVEFFASDAHNFVSLSREIALYLYELQAGSSSSGMLVAIDGTIGSGKNAGRCLAILKLEMDNALTITPTTDPKGQATFDVQVHEITLKRQARVFKAAVFERADGLASLRAVVSDNQRDEATYGPEVAQFFMRFLGCTLRDTADRATKRYLEVYEEFVNSIEDESERRRLIIAGLGDLASNAEFIDPMKFAKEAMTPQQRDEFKKRLANEDGSVPVIPKDRSLVARRLDKVMAEFSEGITVVGSRTAIDERLRPSEEGGWHLDADLRHIGPTGRR